MAETRFHTLLKTKILEEIGNRRDSIASGAAINFEHYRENVGYLQGLQTALNLCDEVEREFE